jgi:hypothetical protein
MDELYEDRAVSSSPVPGLLYTAGSSTSSRMNRCLHGLMMITIYAILDEEMEERDDGLSRLELAPHR